MLKKVMTHFIRRKNPAFEFDESISDGVIREFAWAKFWAFARSWKLLLRGHVPRRLFFGKNVRLSYLKNIRFGRMVQLEDHVKISALGRQPIRLGDRVRIGAFSRLITSTTFDNLGSHISIGNNVGIGEFAYLGGAGGLEIGDDCIIGQYLSCHPENHIFENENELIRLQGTTRKGIRIGKNCWIGAKVTILDGVEIGDNCVIAAGAVVTKSMPPDSVIGGVPARVIKSRKDMGRKAGNREFELSPGTSPQPPRRGGERPPFSRRSINERAHLPLSEGAGGSAKSKEKPQK